MNQKNILIIEDEPKIRSLFRRGLKEAGYSTIEADNGEAALKTLKNYNNTDLIILDIALQKISGLYAFGAIKKDYPQMKIIISSVYPKDEQEFFIFDADDYYYKSDSISILIDKVDKLLGSCRS